MMKALIEVDEVVAVLREALAGRVSARSDLSQLNWWKPSIQDVELGEWRFVVFIEAEVAVEVEMAYAPDGRVQDFTADLGSNPLLCLDDAERRQFERMLGCPE